MAYKMIGSVPKNHRPFEELNMAMDNGSQRFEIGNPNREIGQIVSDQELWADKRPSLIGKVHYLLDYISHSHNHWWEHVFHVHGNSQGYPGHGHGYGIYIPVDENK